MKRIGFAMQLKPGKSAEYKRRHDEIWPKLAAKLSSAGIYDYIIFLDKRTNTLFASQKVIEGHSADRLAEKDIVKEWWTFMADLMETNPDDSPVVNTLDEMFYLE
ncbi:MAG: L-rhamnose mutarotase [Spirochaetia bacterium]|jgi:L-rhamnose mutarotase|nr:L-rhamnose mutarotase [Spirochaetia bacterium]